MAGLGSLFSGFVAGATAGAKLSTIKDDREYKKLRNRVLKQKADQLDDPEFNQLQKDVLRGRANRLNRGFAPVDPNLSKSRALDVQIKQQQLDMMRNPPKEPSAADTAPSGLGTAPSVGPQSDAGDMGDDAYDTADMGVDPYEDVTMAARGGMIRRPSRVKKYADGGAVEDDSEDTAPEMAVDTSSPADEGDDSEGDSLDIQDNNDEARGYSPEAGHDAALAGLKYAAKAHGVTGKDEGVATDFSAARRQSGARAYLQGGGAATADEMAAVKKVIDPENKMSESERNFAALSHVYTYYLGRNEPEKATHAASAMVQQYRIASDRYKAIATAAAESGDVNGALRNILRAHANVPDGQDLKLTNEGGKIGYSFTDVQSGKTVNKGVASPEEILSWATKGGMGNFDSLIAAAGGQRAAGKAPKEDKGVSLKDGKEAREQLDSAWDDVAGSLTNADGKPVEVDAKAAASTKTDAYHIFLAPQNRKANVTPREAAMVAGALAIPDPADPTGKPFKIQTVDGGRVVKLNSGRSAFVPEAQFNQLIAARGKAQQKLAKPAPKSDAGDETSVTDTGPGIVRGAIDAYQRGAAKIPAQGPATYGNPLTELATTGHVSGRDPVRPQAVPMSDLDRINAARRSSGQPPITQEQLSQVR